MVYLFTHLFNLGVGCSPEDCYPLIVTVVHSILIMSFFRPIIHTFGQTKTILTYFSIELYIIIIREHGASLLISITSNISCLVTKEGSSYINYCVVNLTMTAPTNYVQNKKYKKYVLPNRVAEQTVLTCLSFFLR